MKKFFSKLAIVALAVALCVTFAGCNIVTVYVPTENKPDQEIGSSSATVTEKTIIPDNTTTDSYGKTYKVTSVNLQCADKKGDEKDSISATKAVYESNVTVESLVSGSSVYGSGTIIDIDVTYENGDYDNLPFLYILTCHHVIDGASEVVVYIPIDNTETEEVGDYDYSSIVFPATLMGSDKDTDIAILRIEINDTYKEKGFSKENYTDKIKKAQIGAYDLQTGEKIFAIGCPTGSLPGTVSYGHVSNLYRKVNVSDIGEMTLHQTDTATNKGNSGGGIYNYAGQLVGMLNSGDTERDGISFFIPILGGNGIQKIATQLIETVTDDDYGYIEGRWKLGASFVQDQMGGIYITNIIEGSAIANAKIPDGRYIFSMSYTKDGKENSCKLSTLTDFDTFYQQMKKDLEIDDTVKVTYGYYTRGNRQVVEDTVEITITQYIYAPAK